jgi:putative GTP pyrophosphokinase
MADDLLAAAGLSKGAVDRLGEAMRRGVMTEEQITAFGRYRRGFGVALLEVVELIRATTSLEVMQRQKTMRSTAAKLQRVSARLSQVQDIAGCRLVVPTVREQDQVIAQLLDQHGTWRVHDRRAKPSHGYRAVHIVAFVGRVPVEVQIRTELQHRWAGLSEAWDHRYEGVKYGRGPANVLTVLDELSTHIMLVEQLDVAVFGDDDTEHRQRVHTSLIEAIEAASPPAAT